MNNTDEEMITFSEEVVEGVYGKVGEATLFEVEFGCFWVQLFKFSASIGLDFVGVEDWNVLFHLVAEDLSLFDEVHAD